jgi:tetratricopeptide (TPR) repeat protein
MFVIGCAEQDQYREYTSEQRKRMSIEHFEQAEKHFNQGSPENMELIETSLELDPNNSAAWRELSVPYLKRGLAHEWKPLFDKAVEVDPIQWQGWRGYLELYFYRDYESAIKDFNATDSLTPNFTDYPQGMSVDYLRGLAYLQLSEHEKALHYFTTYIEEVTKKNGEEWVDVNVFIYRAINHHRMKNNLDAIKDLETCLKYYPQSSDAYYHLAVNYFELGKKENALKHITKAKELFGKGYFMQVSYVETFEQIYLSDIEETEKKISE